MHKNLRAFVLRVDVPLGEGCSVNTDEATAPEISVHPKVVRTLKRPTISHESACVDRTGQKWKGSQGIVGLYAGMLILNGMRM